MKSNFIKLFIFAIFIFVLFVFMFQKSEYKSFIINENLSFEYYSSVSLKDIVSTRNIEIINKDELLDTRSLGKKEVLIKYNDGKLKEKTITYNIVDNTKPLIIASNTKVIKIGSNESLTKGIICGDNYDKNIECKISGDYNINRAGTYNLKYTLTDSSNNYFEKEFTLKVVSSIDSNNYSPSSYKISNLIKNHKNDNTMIGIDVSDWQGTIDWNKVKNDGVEFAIIRIGYGHFNNKLIFDSKYKYNLENAKKVGIKVGLYFYSYATNENDAKNQAKWIIESLNGEKLDLPIAFDWESWSKFNSYNISFTDLNNTAESFINEINKNGYEGIIYGSATYLSKIWKLDNHRTWLAHYTKETDYKKPYYIWQLSNTGKVNGINGYVDLDILYN